MMRKLCHSERFCIIISVLLIQCLLTSRGIVVANIERNLLSGWSRLLAIYTVVQEQGERMLGRKIAVEVEKLHTHIAHHHQVLSQEILQVIVISMTDASYWLTPQTMKSLVKRLKESLTERVLSCYARKSPQRLHLMLMTKLFEEGILCRHQHREPLFFAKDKLCLRLWLGQALVVRFPMN